MESVEHLAVLTVKHEFSKNSYEEYEQIQINRFLDWRFITMNKLKKLFFKQPLQAIKGFSNKLFNYIYARILPKRFLQKNTVAAFEMALQTIKAEEFDVIIAVAGNFNVVEAVRIFVNKNPNVKFIIYQVDPCASNEIFDRRTYNDRIRFEKNAYVVADHVLTTKIICDEVDLRYDGVFSSKFHAVEFPNVSQKTIMVPENDRQEVIKCIFAGSLSLAIRNPEYTYRLFVCQDAQQVRFDLIGVAVDELPVKYRNGCINCFGRLSLDDAREKMSEADVLVNIGNSMTNQVPSKLFEYISYGKPIVNICKNRNCPTLPYLDKYPYVLNLFEEDNLFDEQVEKLHAFIATNGKKRIPSQKILSMYETCTPEYCATQMLEVFEKCIKKS